MFAGLVCCVLFVQVENQHIVNVQEESNRFYCAVALPSGYRTEIPVIDGYLPQITEFRCCNRTDLVLDYDPSVRTRFRADAKYSQLAFPKPKFRRWNSEPATSTLSESKPGTLETKSEGTPEERPMPMPELEDPLRWWLRSPSEVQ